MKLFVQAVDLIEHPVTVAVADYIVSRAGLVITRIKTPGPEPFVAGEADDAVAACIQVLRDPGLVFSIAVTISIALIMLLETRKIRRHKCRRIQVACQRYHQDDCQQ